MIWIVACTYLFLVLLTFLSTMEKDWDNLTFFIGCLIMGPIAIVTMIFLSPFIVAYEVKRKYSK